MILSMYCRRRKLISSCSFRASINCRDSSISKMFLFQFIKFTSCKGLQSKSFLVLLWDFNYNKLTFYGCACKNQVHEHLAVRYFIVIQFGQSIHFHGNGKRLMCEKWLW